MSEHDQVRSVMALVSRFRRVLVEETSLLRQMQIERIEALRTEKEALAAAYERDVHALCRSPQVLTALSPSLRSELQDCLRSFEVIAADNARALSSARHVVERLLRRLAREPDGAGGKADGKAYGGRAAQTVSLAVDRAC